MMDVAVTGIGLSTPLALHRQHSWRYLCDAQLVEDCALPKILQPDLAPYARACPMTSSGSHRIFNLGLHTLNEALQNANLNPQDYASERWAMALSVSKLLISQRLSAQEIFEPDHLGRWLAQYHAWQGRRINYVAACATGSYSIFNAARWLQEGLCDVAIAGAAEASLQDLYVAGFLKLGVLSKTPRPFDVARNGFMMAEGAGVFTLELLEKAQARSATVQAIFKGGALGSDTFSPTAFRQDGSSIAAVIFRALKACNLKPQQMDYVHLHGTGTRLNDLAEARAMHSVFKEQMPHVSSSKSSYGHSLGASGALGAAVACLALIDQTVPPTAGLKQLDAQCDLPCQATAQKAKLNYSMSLSFGFGGSIAALIFENPKR